MSRRGIFSVLFLSVQLSAHADRWRPLPFLDDIFRYADIAADSLENGVERLANIANMMDDKGVIRTDIKRQDEYTAWRLIPTGERSRETGQLTYFIQNVGTGRYISGVGVTSLGQARAWQWVFYPRLRDSLYLDYPDICHFAQEGDTLMGYAPKDSLWDYLKRGSLCLIQFYESAGYDRYLDLMDSLNNTMSVEDFYVVGTEPGQIPEKLYDRMAFTSNYLKSLSSDLDDTIYDEAVNRFYRDKRAADSAATNVEEGFYRIYDQTTDQQTGNRILYGNGRLLCLKNLEDKEDFADDNSPKGVFHITRRADGDYNLQCIYDSFYLAPSQAQGDTMRFKSAMPQKGFSFDAWRFGRLKLMYKLSVGSDVFCHYLSSLSLGTNQDAGFTGISSRTFSSAFYLKRVAASEVDSLRHAALQTRRDVRLAELADEARTLLHNSIIYTCDTLQPVVRSVGQLDCNALSTGYANRDLTALLDGSIETRIVTQSLRGRMGDSVYAPKLDRNVPLPNAPHYLQITAIDGALPDSVLIRWAIYPSLLQLAPTGLRLQRSRDGQTWETFAILGHATETFATTRKSPVYTSSLIAIGSGYPMLRMEVTANVGGTTDRNGHFAMALSEFNLYPIEGIDPRSQGLRSEVRMAGNVLQSALNSAFSVIPRTTTNVDIATLQNAIKDFRAVWADTTRLHELTTFAIHCDTTASVGTSIGQTTEQVIADLHQAVMQVKALRPYYLLTRAQVDTAAVHLAQALAVYQALVIMPDEHESYFFVSASMGKQRNQCLVATDYIAGSRLNVLGTTAANEQNAHAAWRFIAQAERGVYGVQNLASGLYLGLGSLSDTLVPFRLLTLGASQMAITTVPNGRMLSAQLTDGTLAHNDAQNNVAWIFEAVDHERMTDIKYLHPRAAQVVCVPYATTQLPTSLYAPMEWYEPLGLKCDEEGRIVGLALELTPDAALQPGKPYVLVMGPSIESDDDDLAVDMCMDLDAFALLPQPTIGRGLRGTFNSLRIAQSGLAYFDHSNMLRFSTDTAEVLISIYSGFICPAALPRIVADAPADLTLPVEKGYNIVQFSDHNSDGCFNLPDVMALINAISSGKADPLGLFDHNGDGCLNQPDAIRLIEQIAGE